ncbi:hypothetical protein Tco_0013662 [Tanacetum coccineum]
MFNDVKLQVDYECEMAFELLRLVKKQLNSAGTKVTTVGVETKGIQDPLKWDQLVVSELVALRNFAKKTWIKTQYIWWLHQKCLCSNQNTGRKLTVNVTETIGFDKSQGGVLQLPQKDDTLQGKWQGSKEPRKQE